MNTNPTVVVENLTRIYETSVGVVRRKRRTVEALRGISLEVLSGEVFGLVGPNGAGKTTLIKILTTLLVPTGGRATVLGFDVAREERQIRPRINFILGGERGLYWRLSGYDNLAYFADLYQIDRGLAKIRIEELLKLVGLWERREERVEGYSKGMKQRLHVAKALINEPRVLFLDEPTIGLDPVAARALRRLIQDTQGYGVTILLASHYMWEMEALCDRIAVLNEGRILALDTPAALARHVQDLEVVEVQALGGLEEVVQKILAMPCVETASLSASGQVQTLQVQTHDTQTVIAEIRRMLPDADFSRLTARPPNLEDAYIRLVGGEA